MGEEGRRLVLFEDEVDDDLTIVAVVILAVDAERSIAATDGPHRRSRARKAHVFFSE